MNQEQKKNKKEKNHIEKRLTTGRGVPAPKIVSSIFIHFCHTFIHFIWFFFHFVGRCFISVAFRPRIRDIYSLFIKSLYKSAFKVFFQFFLLIFGSSCTTSYCLFTFCSALPLLRRLFFVYLFGRLFIVVLLLAICI